MNQIRKRVNSNYYKSLVQFQADWQLMFNNARTYNQEGSWVYVDAEEMEKVFNDAVSRFAMGSGMPGAGSVDDSANAGSGGEEDLPPQPRSKSASRARQILSDDDDEYMSDNSDE
jgi:ATP-dependent helicase STH1/SNF2